jgi:putative ABC transport system ATP-binding protein
VTGGAAVDVAHVSRSFDGGRIRALADVTFAVAPGELVAVTGPSGGGKSTLLNLVGALDRPDAGTIGVDGVAVERLRDPTEYRASTLGFVFQFHHLIPTLTALENVQLAMLGRGIARGARVARSRELLTAVGLGERGGSRPPTLSGGERHRVALARALANRPRLLLADEPTGALDTATGEQILALLREVRAEQGTTVLLVTNDPAVAAQADRTLRIRDGRIDELTPAAAPRSA